jgi:hypothetical protein
MIDAEGYTINVSCDFHEWDGIHPWRGEFYGVTKQDAYAALRKAGWKTYPAQRLAKCPACVKAGISEKVLAA